MAKGRFRKLVTGVAVYVAIIAVTLLLVDAVLILTGAFPPTVDPGEPDVGWLAAEPREEGFIDRCLDPVAGEMIEYRRNRDGVRTELEPEEVAALDGVHRIAVMGDSHTDLCAPNAATHPGVLETTLDEAGVPSAVFNYGAGRYSPLQSYVAFEKYLLPYEPDVFVLNLYTGNDFNDLLRIDDRPHFVKGQGGYEVAPPVWYRSDDPETERTSRILFLGHSLLEATGVRNQMLRFRFLRAMAAEQGEGVGTVLGYMNDLRKSVEPSLGYPGALAAQMLNQQLFFRRFPASRDESVARLDALLGIVRREHPDLTLVMSPVPSYVLVGEQPVDSAVLATLERLDLPLEEAVRQEEELYRSARALSEKHGWLFVDNLASLRAYGGSERLFNDFDYHITPTASEIVGRNEGEALLRHFAAGDAGDGGEGGEGGEGGGGAAPAANGSGAPGR